MTQEDTLQLVRWRALAGLAGDVEVVGPRLGVHDRAAELVHAGYPAKDVVIAADPEAFGNMSLGTRDASDQDRRVTILFAR